ncbi:Uncharacterized protein FWK35_00034589, partial [Aphis craccivora]
NIYKLYFGCPLGDQDKAWAPHTRCSACSNGLRDWLDKRKSSMPFAIPMIWREQKNHYNDCYFYSAIRPVIHNTSLPIPIPPEEGLNFNEEMECDQDSFDHDDECPGDANYTPVEDTPSSQTFRFNQDELNDLIRDMILSKEKAELLASRLKQKNLL